jgi:glycosyltransferase involved in cell wall biosynthesis
MPERSVTPVARAPRVSVVIPVFNAETYVAAAIESVLGQTLEDFELIAVDDASEDGSPELLERLARSDRRIRVITNDQNLGLSGARNRGWRVARARYIAFLDADDVALPDRLSRQVEFLDAHPPVAAVGGAVITIDDSGRRISSVRYPTKNRAIQSRLLRHICAVCQPAVTMRRAALEAVGGYRFRCVEDYDLLLRLSERFELANLQEPVILYRLHLHQLSLVVLERGARDARAVCAAARARRVSGVDPFAGAYELTPEILGRVEIDEAEIAAAVEAELIARAAVLVNVGHRDEAERLLEQASRSLGRRAVNAFSVMIELQKAMALLRTRRPLRALGHILVAFGREPRHAVSQVTSWLGPRVPGGVFPRWR